MAIEIIYRGHRGEHREYHICDACGTAFYDDTFDESIIIPCPVCCRTIASTVDKEKFETYIKAHNNLANSISIEGCADRAPDRS